MSDQLVAYLTRPRTAFVEPVALSGLTESGIYVLDHDDAKNVGGSEISLLWRVLDIHPDCRYLNQESVGKVYQAANPYAFTTVLFDGSYFDIMHEDNLICEVAGYDEQAVLNEQELHDQPEAFPICGK